MNNYRYIMILLLLLFLLTFRVGKTEGISMEPSILNGEKFIFTSFKVPPDRFDIVIIDNYDRYNRGTMKRIVGMPNDIVLLNSKNRVVAVNNQILPNSVISKDDINKLYAVKVPADKYYVIGDNQEFSLDSRNMGFIDREDIIGIVLMKISKKINK